MDSQELTSSEASLKGKLLALSAERNELVTQRDSLSEQLEQLRQNYQRVSDDYKRVDRTYRELVGEKQQDEKMFTQALDDIQKEADATLGDYNETACKLKEIEEERDGFRMKHEQSLNILAQRTKEVMDTKKELESREQEWRVILESRLEEQRKEAEDSKVVMIAQVSVKVL